MDSLPRAAYDAKHLRSNAFMALTANQLGVSGGELQTLQQVYETELATDAWLPGEASYRRRGYQCFAVDPSTLSLTPLDDPPPYLQPMNINPVAGGIARSFRLVPYSHPVTGIVTTMLAKVLIFIQRAGLLDARGRVADVHYIRILAPGEPAPEGIHRDGLIAGSVHLIRRCNVRGGMSMLFDSRERKVCEFTLIDPLDSFIFDDEKLLHFAERVERVEPELPGHRDALLFGIRTESGK